MDYSGGMQFYYSPVDRRFHLYGAEVGWTKVDYDNDHFMDMFIWMEDEDKDGFFDTWKYDINGDCLGKEHDELTYYSIWKYEPKGEEFFERVVHVENDSTTVIPFDYWTLHDQYVASLSQAAYINQILTGKIKKLLRRYEQDLEIDPVEDYFNTSLASYRKDYHIGEKIKNSNEGARFYQDIIRERYWQRLKQTSFVQDPSFQEIETLYNKGNFEEVYRLLHKQEVNRP